jgi:hypothetical protein
VPELEDNDVLVKVEYVALNPTGETAYIRPLINTHPQAHLAAAFLTNDRLETCQDMGQCRRRHCWL